MICLIAASPKVEGPRTGTESAHIELKSRHTIVRRGSIEESIYVEPLPRLSPISATDSSTIPVLPHPN